MRSTEMKYGGIAICCEEEREGRQKDRGRDRKREKARANKDFRER